MKTEIIRIDESGRTFYWPAGTDDRTALLKFSNVKFSSTGAHSVAADIRYRTAPEHSWISVDNYSFAFAQFEFTGSRNPLKPLIPWVVGGGNLTVLVFNLRSDLTQREAYAEMVVGFARY